MTARRRTFTAFLEAGTATNATAGLLPGFTARLVFSVDALHAALEVQQRRDGLFQTFPVVLVLAAFLELL